jgi:hypothetical protein
VLAGRRDAEGVETAGVGVVLSWVRARPEAAIATATRTEMTPMATATSHRGTSSGARQDSGKRSTRVRRAGAVVSVDSSTGSSDDSSAVSGPVSSAGASAGSSELSSHVVSDVVSSATSATSSSEGVGSGAASARGRGS